MDVSAGNMRSGDARGSDILLATWCGRFDARADEDGLGVRGVFGDAGVCDVRGVGTEGLELLLVTGPPYP
jgi:hypothetical protein